MTDDRTAEQLAADEALEEAIRLHLAAYDEGDGLVMEWVLLVTQHLDDGSDSTATAVSRWVRAGQPIHRTMGLLDYGLTRLRATVAGNADLEPE